MGTMKYYVDCTHYVDRKDWRYIPHLIRPYFDKPVAETDKVSADYMTEDINLANCAILPMMLEYYSLKGKQDDMLDFIGKAKEKKLPVIAFNDDDYGVVPVVKDIVILTQNAYQSKRLPKEYGSSFIIDDPMAKYFPGDKPFIRNKSCKPVVGFDGLAKESFIRIIYHGLQHIIHNLKFYTGLSVYSPTKILPAVLIRARALNILEHDKRIVTNFNKRNRFRGGAKNAQEQTRKTLEFYQNMKDSDYIICARGGGNFSSRFYETLAMGRVPVFINTDCILPFDNLIDWRKYCVWVEKEDLRNIGEKIIEFHQSLSNEEFIKLQVACRTIWQQYLSREGEMSKLETII